MRILALPAALAVLLLCACAGFGGGGNDPQNEAETYCEQQVAATFDDPDAVEFTLDEGGPDGDEHYAFQLEAELPDGTRFDVECAVSGTPGSFVLESYNVTPR